MSKIKFPIKEDKVSAIRNLAKRYKTTIDFHVGDIAELPFEDERFDRVYSISVLEHMEQGQDEKAMKEMSRVLKPGGRLLVTVDFAPNPMPRKSYTEKDIHRLIKISGLELSGNYDYSTRNWQEHLTDLTSLFNKSNVELSSAGFILVKN
jgi:ubiquinone/menaquinone biosynthesis C-methylase UbiE